MLSAQFSMNDFSFNAYPGAERTAVGFVMLEGLNPGKNFLWNLDLTKRVAGNMEINLQYEGRKSSSVGRMIHIGKAAVRAVF